MNITLDKIIALIKALKEQTALGKLSWDKDESQYYAFYCVFNNFGSVTIMKFPSSEAGGYGIRIDNKAGELVSAKKFAEQSNYFQDIQDLFEMIDNIYYKKDETINGILDMLK